MVPTEKWQKDSFLAQSVSDKEKGLTPQIALLPIAFSMLAILSFEGN